jgi:hypothetical protein
VVDIPDVASILILVGSTFMVIGLSLALLAAGCIPGQVVSEGGELREMTGRLGGEGARNEFENACIWLVGADGKRTHLLIMDDSVIQSDPLRLVDGSGRTIAAVGDAVTAVGPTRAIGDNGCAAIEEMFVVDQLIGPRGTWREELAP